MTFERSQQVAPAAPPLPSFPHVYEEHFDYVYNSLRRLGATPADVEDLTQDVFVTAYRRLHIYDPARPLKPWLFGIAFRVLADRRKSAQNRELATEHIEVSDEGRSLDAHLATREARDVVLWALQKLPLERRAVFVMHELHGSTAPEIADALDVPLNTVYTRLRLARRDFTEAVRVQQAGRVAP